MTRIRTTRPLLLLALVWIHASRAYGAPESAAEIEQCMRDNLPSKSSVQTVVFRSTDRAKSVSESRATLHWQKGDDGMSKVLLRFAKPHELRGAGVLLIETKGRAPDTMLYLPEVRKVRRVSSRAAATSVFGTDFSYEDFQRLLGMSAAAGKEREEDAEIAGRSAYVVVARPPPEAKSAYERVVTFVDKKTCVPLTTESYEPGGKLRKRVVVDPEQITEEGGLWIPRSQTITDLRDETHTEFMVEEIEVDAKIHRKMFSERELEAGAR